MLFSSLIFMTCFLPVVLVVYYLILKNRREAQNVFLFLASLAFYAWGEPWFVLVLILSIVGNWKFGLLADRHRQTVKGKAVIASMLLFNLTIIFIFKYLLFTMQNINLLLRTDFAVPRLILPIGISFFTFQAISYVLDIYRGNAQVQHSPLNVGLYIAFFPQLVAGPIIRYETIAAQIMGRRESWDGFSQGTCRFILGFGKKVLLANNLALVADTAFVLPNEALALSFSWLGILAYTLQIYFDFSGYSDMAIGMGRMFGFTFPENFNYPYISTSISEFWRRWHISLGAWFRDYVYFPLGGSKVSSPLRLVFNLLAVWFLTGLWHGANWTFICWGLLYFLLISIEKVGKFEKQKSRHIAVSLGRHVYTMLMVMIGWVFFRATSITDAFAYLSTMFGFGKGPLNNAYFMLNLLENRYFFLFGLLFSTPIFPAFVRWGEGLAAKGVRISAGLFQGTYICGLLLVLLAALSYLVKGAYNPFIYFNF